MEAYDYFNQNPDLAALHVAVFFFVLGLVIGWVLWAGNRRQLRRMDAENAQIAKQLEADCNRQIAIEQRSSQMSC